VYAGARVARGGGTRIVSGCAIRPELLAQLCFYRSSEVRPVCFAILASMRGPTSSES
jgi:hypothetical protein